ncbi:putative transcription factor GRF family [Medicago truncatula]|nr:GRF zinc finger protein [Medicago truncatula]RHN71538.1 putative transcription factor GRF family [Medicago truncatula]
MVLQCTVVNSKTSSGMLPTCHCGLPIVIYIANTRQNKGRRFLKCCNWMKNNTCDLLIWDDLLAAGTRPMVAVTSKMSIVGSREVSFRRDVESKEKKSNCAIVMQGVYELKKDKWKKNLLVEKKKVE